MGAPSPEPRTSLSCLQDTVRGSISGSPSIREHRMGDPPGVNGARYGPAVPAQGDTTTQCIRRLAVIWRVRPSFVYPDVIYDSALTAIPECTVRTSNIEHSSQRATKSINQPDPLRNSSSHSMHHHIPGCSAHQPAAEIATSASPIMTNRPTDRPTQRAGFCTRMGMSQRTTHAGPGR